MKKISLLTLTLFLSTFCVIGQDFSMEFGKPSDHEFKMNSYAKDKEAEALIIYDKAVTKFMLQSNNSFLVVMDHKKKIKIFDESGLNFGEISILVYRDGNIYEEVERIEAYTYNYENGMKKRTPLDPKNIYEEKVSDKYYEFKFAMPDVKPGSIIEYRYRFSTQSKFHLPDWYFQDRIPTHYSEYAVHLTPFYEYVYLLQGKSQFDVYNEDDATGLPTSVGGVTYKEKILTMGMKEVPAFRDEEFITSREDYLMKIDFQLAAFSDVYGVREDIITTWPKLNEELLRDVEFGKYLKQAEKAGKKALPIELLKALPRDESLKFIVNHVKNNYNWNGRRGYMTDKSVKKFEVEKTGDIPELNLYLCGLLRAADMEAYPVLLSTRDHGKIRADYPFASFFNYVIVAVKTENGYRLLDASDTFHPFDLIPRRCINENGLIVEDNKANWLPLSYNAKSAEKFSFTISTSPESDSLSVIYRKQATGYDAVDGRKRFYNEPDKLEDFFLDKNLIPVNNAKALNFDTLSKPFEIHCKANYPKEQIDSKVFISPFFGEVMNENPFKQNDRTYPIDLIYARTRHYQTEIIVPEGYKVESLPQDMEMNGTDMTIQYKIHRPTENKILISAMYRYNSPVYEAEDYRNLKYYCSQIINKFNEKVVLAPVEE